MLLDKERYTESVETDLYFFKSVGYRDIDNFQTSDLTLGEGEKANGYKSLTSSPKVVNIEYVNEQISVIDQLIEDAYYNNWSRVVGEIVTNYQGMNSITSQIEEAEREKQAFLVESVQYMGYTLEELQAARQTFVDLSGGIARDITLNNLHMHSSGYIFTEIKPVEKVLNQEMLPYVTINLLDTIGKIDQESTTQLKVVNNDHLFIAFTVDKDVGIMGEEEMMELKEEMVGTTDKGINQEYYDFLVRRIDQLLYYPEIRFKYDDKEYSSYLIDEVEDSDKKIVILMLKDYVNVFSQMVMTEAEVYLQDYDAFVIPETAVYTDNDENYVQTVSKGYFNDPLPVEIEKTVDGDVVLKTSANPYLSSGTRIRIYP
ncbi:hypothetical protein Q5O24_08240 [Eubacteriaceae bacterium ES3]|nr:hypothetical protein Q5O24_08240 [Eubacteriaceae bacterium ES3]